MAPQRRGACWQCYPANRDGCRRPLRHRYPCIAVLNRSNPLRRAAGKRALSAACRCPCRSCRRRYPPPGPRRLARARAVDLRSWWTALDDPRLNALVEEALRRNLTWNNPRACCRASARSLVAGARATCRVSGSAPARCRTPRPRIPISTPASTWSGSWACSARPRAAGCRPARTPTWPPLASRACACRWSRPWCATIWTWAWPTVRSRC